MHYHKRIEYLEKWRLSNNRKPLILRGARQVGKTTLVCIDDHTTPAGKAYKLMNLPYYMGTYLQDYISYFISEHK
ncbi:MAG: hypothetical protein ACK5IQ_04620 [Bacteroidales bacterium]